MRVLGETDPRLERYRPIIRGVVGQYRHAGCKQTDDLEQEASLAVWRNLHRIDASRGTANAYVGRTAKGAIQHWFRDTYPHIHVPRWRQEKGERPPEVLSLDALMEDDEEGGEMEIGFTEAASE